MSTTLLILGTLLACAAPGSAQAPTRPGQPAYGPGGKDVVSAGVRISHGGVGANAFYVFEPVRPQPATAPVTVITHGFFETFGYQSQQALIRHTVAKGSIVVYPRWQTTAFTPCRGSFDIEPCVQSTAKGINGAMAFLRADPTRVQPDGRGATYFGLSFGGDLVAAVTNRWQELGVPQPRAVLLDEPHDGALAGLGEPSLPAGLPGLPADTLVVCHDGMEGVLTERGKADSSCNAIMPRLVSVLPQDKNLVMLSRDDHGSPVLRAQHALCGGNTVFSVGFPVDTYDYRFCFRQLDSLRSCASDGVDCATAIGNTPEHRYLGTWSDGVGVIGLKVQAEAPIRPGDPVPAREPAPPGVAP